MTRGRLSRTQHGRAERSHHVPESDVSPRAVGAGLGTREDRSVQELWDQHPCSGEREPRAVEHGREERVIAPRPNVWAGCA